MYQAGDHHVYVLAASIRSVDQLLACFSLGVELVTVPVKVLDAWAAKGLPMPGSDFVYQGVNKEGQALKPIPYKNIDLNRSLDSYDLRHDLTTKGIEKFVADFESTLRQPEGVH